MTGRCHPQVVLLGSVLVQGLGGVTGSSQPAQGRFGAAAQRGVVSHHDAEEQPGRSGVGFGEAASTDDPAPEPDTSPCKRVLLRVQ